VNVNDALSEATVPDGPPVIVVSGAVVSPLVPPPASCTSSTTIPNVWEAVSFPICTVRIGEASVAAVVV
jgi:hypothetical protein